MAPAACLRQMSCKKELLLILAEQAAAPDILEAIRRMPCLNEPGIGIAFCMAVESFFPLGRAGATD